MEEFYDEQPAKEEVNTFAIDNPHLEINHSSCLGFYANGPKSELTPVEGFLIQFDHAKPNWWWRMWQWILLGWRWRSLDE